MNTEAINALTLRDTDHEHADASDDHPDLDWRDPEEREDPDDGLI
jgi:hypothetical protein